ncbi:TRAP-type mannitol/chloroaromatic compound transport system%2C periplasmic component [Achromobacter xylosoxidans]|uniref:twin-arginine translocation signal domain-containing protein n=1 Tax=Alcaligenes xylosoxydans xylosoxydans TaxID=85698 RepID=UPI0006C6A74C|nr:twin-arginine translocation signal domain-containing protein [Achromobacter xylosoxidans]CUJ56116.1 TRAP-type mannitol/chloroaromatic compound transport system%2C periplasmic component [Achromobacter xylosoxidans]CUK20927.1 TRAP-type mannitol/chloroaromatic compound transport system%2C periplasmic component [Achromobacter xylosoxidans]
MQRRSFLKQAGLGAVAAGAAVSAPALAQDSPSISWRLASGFPAALDLRFGAGEIFRKFVSEATGGKFSIKQLAEGEVAPAAQLMDAVGAATVECAHVSSGIYFAKNPAFCFDSAVPFGLDAGQMNAWMLEGDGLRLVRELFKAQKIINFPLGNTGSQMGLWSNREIKRATDLKDLRMRVDGLAAQVLAHLGVLPQQTGAAAQANDGKGAEAAQDAKPAEAAKDPKDAKPAEGSKPADAAAKAGPDAVAGAGAYDDGKLGLNKAARFYYGPSWWAASEQLSLYINEEAWAKLPKHYQAVVEAAALAAHARTTAAYAARNPAALAQLVAAGAQVRALPRSVMDAAFEATQQVYKDLGEKDPKFKAIHDSYMGFRDNAMPWLRLTEGAYDQYLGVALSARS